MRLFKGNSSTLQKNSFVFILVYMSSAVSGASLFTEGKYSSPCASIDITGSDHVDITQSTCEWAPNRNLIADVHTAADYGVVGASFWMSSYTSGAVFPSIYADAEFEDFLHVSGIDQSVHLRYTIE